jgi:hypothetical protein
MNVTATFAKHSGYLPVEQAFLKRLSQGTTFQRRRGRKGEGDSQRETGTFKIQLYE